MDIAALSVALSQQRVNQDLGVTTLKMAMDSSKQTADLVSEISSSDTKAMEVAAQPYLGTNVDIAI